MTDTNQLMRPVINPATRFGMPAAQPSPLLGNRQLANVLAPRPAATPPGNNLMQPVQAMRPPSMTAAQILPHPPEGERSTYGTDKEVSTALPSQKTLGHDPHGRTDMLIDTNAMRGYQHPKAAAKFQEAMARAAPDYDHVPPRSGDFAEDLTRHLHDNITHVWANIRSKPWVHHAINWYKTANTLTSKLADEAGVTHHQAAAVVAALSPQKDWDMNVNLAERVLDIHKNHQDKKFDDQMRSFVQGHVAAIKKDVVRKGFQEHLDQIPENGTLRDLKDPIHRAMFIRAFDEAGHQQHADYKYRGSRAYDVISPTGERHPALTKEGAPASVAWSPYHMVANAAKALQSPDMANISRSLGEKHKVRNFYNNIIAPDSHRGHVTIDTHAIAAGHLMPLGGDHPYVQHGLGSGGILGERALTGASGLYGIHADAWRRAAQTISQKEGRRYLPREVQSAVWEATRGMFAGKKDPQGHVAQTAEHVQRLARYGVIAPGTARQWIINAAGGVPDPEWWVRRGQHG